MASLSSRFKEFTQERRALLGALSHVRPGVPDLTQLTDILNEDWLQATYPMAPLLQCDFLIEYQSAPGEKAVLTSADWVLDGLDLAPSELGWKYENTPLAFPTPTVSSANCSITFNVPTGIGDLAEAKGVQWYTRLINLYTSQFSSRGLLKASDLQRSFTVSAIAETVQQNFTSKESLVPLFRLSGLRFGTPKVSKFDPKTAEPLSITLPFVYCSSKTFEFNAMGEPTLNVGVDSLPSVFQSDQFNNR